MTSDEWRVTSKNTIRIPKSEVRSQKGIRASRWTSPYALWFRSALGILCLLSVSAARGDDARKPTVEAIGSEVQCPCGCVAPLNQCPMLNCAEKSEMRAFIVKEIAEGKSETTILQDLSLRYGLQVLSSPPAHGFNLAVWILPGIGLLLGLGIVVVIVRRWKHRPAAAAPAPAAPLDPKVLTAMEEEMKSAGLGKI